MDIEKRIDEIVKGKEVLEIGGLGDFKIYAAEGFVRWRHVRLKEASKRLVGMDIHEEHVNIARENGFNYHVADIEDETLPSRLGQFDVILLLEVIEHLNSVGTALNNIMKLLRFGGMLVVTVPNLFSLNNMSRLVTGRQIEELPDHTCAFLASHFKQLFLRTGLSLEEVDYFTYLDGRSEYTLKSKVIMRVGKLFPMMNTNMLVIGKKREG